MTWYVLWDGTTVLWLWLSSTCRHLSLQCGQQSSSINVPAGHDTNDLSSTSFARESRCHGNCTGAFCDHSVPLDQQSNCVCRFLQTDCDGPRDQSLDVRPHLRENAKTADSIDKAWCVITRAWLACTECHGDWRRCLNLARIQFRLRLQTLKNSSDPAEHPTSTVRHKNRVHRREIFEDFQRNTAISGDYFSTRARVNKLLGAMSFEASRFKRGPPLAVRYRNDVGTIATQSRFLRLGCRVGRDNGAAYATISGTPRQTLHTAHTLEPFMFRPLGWPNRVTTLIF